MILRIDHVSLAVKDYKKAVEFFTKILGAVPQTAAEDPKLKYFWEIFALGDLSRFEIVKPTGDGSFLDNFIKKRKNGIHHMTLQTSDIKKMKEFLDDEKIPYFGYNDYGDSWKELFIHPKDAFGVLIQIGEFEADDWLSEPNKMPKGMKWSFSEKDGKYNLIFAHPGGGKMKLNLNREEITKVISDLEKLIKNT